MIQVRNGVFETNSSSTHSITMCTKEEFQRWKNGKLLYARYDEKFVSPEDANKYDSYELQTYEEFYDDWSLEKFYAEHKTASGEIIVAFGEYGHD